MWGIIEPLLPEEPPKPKGGRPRIDDRAALTGILFVLRGGIPWEMLPQEMGCGSGMTCWRRLQEWHEAGVWDELHAVLLDSLAAADQLDWSRACIDSSSVPAPLAPKRGHKSLKGSSRGSRRNPALPKRPVRTRPTEVNRARSATLS